MTENKKQLDDHIPYWEKEEPLSIRRGKFGVEYYYKAERLILRMTEKDKNGKITTKPGVFLKKDILQENLIQLETLATVFNDWYQEAKELQEAENA